MREHLRWLKAKQYTYSSDGCFSGFSMFLFTLMTLTLSRQRSPSYRNQFIDLNSKSIDWFLYHRGHVHERADRNLERYAYYSSCHVIVSELPGFYLSENLMYYFYISGKLNRISENLPAKRMYDITDIGSKLPTLNPVCRVRKVIDTLPLKLTRCF